MIRLVLHCFVGVSAKMFVHFHVFLAKINLLMLLWAPLLTVMVTCVWSHICVYTKGVCSYHLLKLTVSTKGCVPTLLYGGWVPIDRTVDKNTGLSATRLQLYCSHGDMQAPQHQQHCPALWLLAETLPSYLFLGGACCSAMWRCRHVNFQSHMNRSKVGAWKEQRGLEDRMEAC